MIYRNVNHLHFSIWRVCSAPRPSQTSCPRTSLRGMFTPDGDFPEPSGLLLTLVLWFGSSLLEGELSEDLLGTGIAGGVGAGGAC